MPEPKGRQKELLEKLLEKGVKDSSHDRETLKEFTPRAIATLSERALRGNFRAISEQVPDHSIIPMIKANAYGHGAAWAAKILVPETKLYALGVATLEEGREVREAVGTKYRKTPIIVFSGALPWSDEKGAFCASYHLTPVIASDADWKSFVSTGWIKKIPYEIEFNTGMNRIGISLTHVQQVLRDLQKLPVEQHPSGVLSHLAQGELPDGPLSQKQLGAFRELRASFAAKSPQASFHLANSSGIWNRKKFDLDDLTDVVRPGVSLYGVPPWPGAPARGIEPVLTLHAQVLAVRRLKRGDVIGYGGTYKVNTDEPFYTATLGAGYADGVLRSLSNRGYAWLSGQESRFLGIVSMDLSTVSCDASTREGEWAQILGPQVDIWAQSKAGETVPYELLTSITPRVQRKYE